MQTTNFQNLIQAITGRDFTIKTTDTEIVNGKEYLIYRTLPLTNRDICFTWKAALTNDCIYNQVQRAEPKSIRLECKHIRRKRTMGEQNRLRKRIRIQPPQFQYVRQAGTNETNRGKF